MPTIEDDFEKETQDEARQREQKMREGELSGKISVRYLKRKDR